MAKIAVELERAMARRGADGGPGQQSSRTLARGEGWSVRDVICTSGPRDRPFEERHSQVSIAIVAAGTFQYRSTTGGDLMTPGSFLLGNAGQRFECGHEHGAGDRCISFSYSQAYFESLAVDAGARSVAFRALRLPPMRALSPIVARAFGALAVSTDADWEELGLEVAAESLHIAGDRFAAPVFAPPSSIARVTRAVRRMEENLGETLTIGSLARETGLTPYHFLRTFRHLTGVTPHQYLLRTRLREASLRLKGESVQILDIALDCGFGDVSNFNRAFRAEFGMSPRQYRLRAQ